MKRREFLLSATGLPLLGELARPSRRAAAMTGGEDRVLGAADAPITVVEYASLTCPHCARFHNEALPRVAKAWIDPGRARLAYRHFPLDGLALRAALIADAMPEDRLFFGFIATLFETQAQWVRADAPLDVVASKARDAGMSREQVDGALRDEAAMNALLGKVLDARNSYDVRSTPTFIINGRKFVGVSDYGEFVRALEAASSR